MSIIKHMLIRAYLLFLFITHTLPLWSMQSKDSASINSHSHQSTNFAKALRYSNWIKHIYLYAPKDDPLRILIRTLWHIFYGQADDQMLPTKKGPLAVITPTIFKMLIATEFHHTHYDKAIQKLLYPYQWLELYKQYIPTELKTITNITSHLEKELTHTIQKITDIKENQKKAVAALEQVKQTCKKIVTQANKEKQAAIKNIHQTMDKNSPDKKEAIARIVAQIDKTYNIESFRLSKEQCNQKIVSLKELLKKTEKTKNNLFDEIKTKNKEVTNMLTLLDQDTPITDCIITTIKDLLQKIALARKSTRYLPGTVEAVLEAFYQTKFLPTPVITDQEEEAYKLFEAILATVDTDSQVEQITDNHDLALHALIKKITSGTFPPQIKMDKYPYEFAPDKVTNRFSDCFESSVLDLLSILWYNPITQRYDDALIPPLLRACANTGHKKLKHILRMAHQARTCKIDPTEYTSTHEHISFSSYKKLQEKLQAHNLFETDIKHINLDKISPEHILDKAVRQRWINIISGLNSVHYNQPEYRCEILPQVHNLVEILNFFYGTHATHIQSFNTLLSYKNKDAGIERSITFEVDKKECDTVIIQVMLTIKPDTTLKYTLRLILMDHHAILVCDARNARQNNGYKEDIAVRIAQKITEQESPEILVPLLYLLSNNKVLGKNVFSPPITRAIYYSLDLKNNETKLAIAQHAIQNNLLVFTDIKKLVLKIKDTLKINTDLENRLIASCIQSKAYEQHPEIQAYILQRSTQALSVIANINISKSQFYTLYKMLISHKADINAKWEPHGDTLLTCAIKKDYWDIARNLITHTKIEINKAGALEQTALHIAAIKGCLKTIQALLAHKKIECNPIDQTQNTPINLAAQHNQSEAVAYLLSHPKTRVYTPKNPLHACAESDNMHTFTVILQKTNLNPQTPDYKNNTPLHIAAQNGCSKLITYLAALQEININQPGYKQRTPLILAAKYNALNTVKHLLSIPTIHINATDYKGYTPLSWAIKKNNIPVINALLQNPKLQVNLTDNDGYTPFSWANSPESIKLLCSHAHIDINKTDPHGKTPLYWFAEYGKIDLVKELLHHRNVKPNKASLYGITPLSIAKINGHTEIVKLLKKYA